MPTRTFAILPAAGHSRRIGRPKLLLPLADGRALIEHVLSAWRASSVDEIVVVIRRDDAPLARLCAGPCTTIVQPGVDPPDMKASIAAGIDHLREARQPTDADAWLVAPADMPLLTALSIDAVIAAYRQQLAERDAANANSSPRIVVPHHAGRRGHPVLLPWSIAAELDALGTDEGLKQLIARHPLLTIDVADAGILTDVDTPEDYARLARGFGG
jgi:molybdenum cofactor cytidylyltransferase